MTKDPKDGDLLNRLLNRQQPPEPAAKPVKLPEKSTDVPPAMRAKAVLEGRLADYLGTQDPRVITPKSIKFTSDAPPWIADSPEFKAAAAVALTVTANLARYAHSVLPQNTIEQARDELMQCFSAGDAVKIEAEAYDLLNWFAGAIDKSWQTKIEIQDPSVPGESSEKLLIDILQRAIANSCDLNMNYYTGSRGEFTERQITPIEITAEKHLSAFCHLRRDGRIFRLSRIVKLSPVDKNIPDADSYIFPKPSVSSGISNTAEAVCDADQDKNCSHARNRTELNTHHLQKSLFGTQTEPDARDNDKSSPKQNTAHGKQKNLFS